MSFQSSSFTMRNNKRTLTFVTASTLIASALFLSGCTEEKNEALTASTSPTVEQEGNTETVSNTPETTEISDEAFEKAFMRYLDEKPVEFGKQVDKSYKIYQEVLQKEEANAKAEKAKNVRDIDETDAIQGDKNADFVLFEYSDYQCPYCKQFHPTTKTFLENNDDVALVFRHYPGVHRNTSAPIHQIAACVTREEGNDAFWEFTDIAFEQGSQLTPANVESEMQTLGFQNIENIMKCYKDGDMESLVDGSEAEGKALGINGTPGSILKNMKTGEVRIIAGAYPLEALEAYKKELE